MCICARVDPSQTRGEGALYLGDVKKALRVISSRTGLVLGCVLLVALLWGLTLERVNYEREEAIGDATVQNANLALAFEEHTRSTLRSVDQAVSFLRWEYETEGK